MPAQALLQVCPGLVVGRVASQPRLETGLLTRVLAAGAQAHHPGNGFFGGAVELHPAHGWTPLR
ncbi:hypothetical protein D3C71_2235450 [compost metagenome]